MKKLYCLLLILVLTTGCQNSHMTKYTDYYMDYLDTFSTLTVYAESQASFDTYTAKLRSDLEYYDKLFNAYDDADFNNLKTINDNAGIKPVEVANELFELIKQSKEMYSETDGTINIAMGAVLSIWHDYREEGKRVPSMPELTAANAHTSIDTIVLDEENKTVYITDPLASIDLGATAKGYIGSLIEADLRALGVTSASINIGGNVVNIGSPADKPNFKIAIQSPDESGEILDILKLSDMSAVTSGNYQRYYEVDGKRYHHIIDPQTLMPADKFKSVTVIIDNSTLGDMLSTALFILPQADGEKLAQKYSAEAMWIDSNDTITTTSGYSKYTSN